MSEHEDIPDIPRRWGLRVWHLGWHRCGHFAIVCNPWVPEFGFVFLGLCVHWAYHLDFSPDTMQTTCFTARPDQLSEDAE